MPGATRTDTPPISGTAGRTARSVVHASFTITRLFDASPARVFAAFADPAMKDLWFFGPPEWGPPERTSDFRIGGIETSRTGPRGGPAHAFRAVYQDIVPDERIVYSYEMHLGDRRISVSLATIELFAEGRGTRLKLTEQGAFLDGHDDVVSREHGTRALMEQLAASLEGKEQTP
ncbi:SRPBCC family protein [Kaistia geumhonensis]|uniref:Uncharacterized protein YndB with AHSA1/START domain n=1 Tax=Kaistia geumhonensis TaxID=410839 RepID=A0ABU0M7W9_9HYPH|nr:SRPBCC family protein [Kaistia geumhonensis]MCX5477729.1 SRPBCC family protein [Kaistia geumhonensis]MDQ0517060.1 uncharacterized protein YndB with AHSA1/START domain [Kaistia geumhonensis]